MLGCADLKRNCKALATLSRDAVSGSESRIRVWLWPVIGRSCGTMIDYNKCFSRLETEYDTVQWRQMTTACRGGL